MHQLDGSRQRDEAEGQKNDGTEDKAEEKRRSKKGVKGGVCVERA